MPDEIDLQVEEEFRPEHASSRLVALRRRMLFFAGPSILLWTAFTCVMIGFRQPMWQAFLMWFLLICLNLLVSFAFSIPVLLIDLKHYFPRIMQLRGTQLRIIGPDGDDTYDIRNWSWSIGKPSAGFCGSYFPQRRAILLWHGPHQALVCGLDAEKFHQWQSALESARVRKATSLTRLAFGVAVAIIIGVPVSKAVGGTVVALTGDPRWTRGAHVSAFAATMLIVLGICGALRIIRCASDFGLFVVAFLAVGIFDVFNTRAPLEASLWCLAIHLLVGIVIAGVIVFAQRVRRLLSENV